MKYLLILLLTVSLVTGSTAAILVAKTDQELYNEHDVILIGTVIKAEGRLFERVTDYSIAVEKYLKNDLGPEVQLLASGKKDSNIWVEDETIFEKGDRVLLYLIKNADSYQISPYSHVLEDGSTIPIDVEPCCDFTIPLIIGIAITGVVSFFLWRKRK